MTSPEGETFLLQVKDQDGDLVLLGFPHSQLLNIVEHAAMQAEHGKDQSGDIIVSAFKTTSFELGRGPSGEPVLSMVVGQTGKISFLIPKEMLGQMVNSLAGLLPRN